MGTMHNSTMLYEEISLVGIPDHWISKFCKRNVSQLMQMGVPWPFVTCRMPNVNDCVPSTVPIQLPYTWSYLNHRERNCYYCLVIIVVSATGCQKEELQKWGATGCEEAELQAWGATSCQEAELQEWSRRWSSSSKGSEAQWAQNSWPSFEVRNFIQATKAMWITMIWLLSNSEKSHP